MSCPFIKETTTKTTESVNSHQDRIPKNIQTPIVKNFYLNEKSERLSKFVEHMDESGVKLNEQNKVKHLVSELLKESYRIEEHVRLGENEIFHKNEEAFYMLQDEKEILSMRTKNERNMKELQSRHVKKINDIRSRKTAKKFQRDQQREFKNLYEKTHYQDEAYRTIDSLKKSLLEHRKNTEETIANIEQKHQKQVKQFNMGIERMLVDQRILLEFQTQNLQDEEKNQVVKEYQSKMNCQMTTDKQALYHIQEQQRIELRQYKDKVELERKMMEEMTMLSTRNALEEQLLTTEQRKEYVKEKETLNATHVSMKIFNLQMEQALELQRLAITQRRQLRQLAKNQLNKRVKRMKHWSAILNRELTAIKKASGRSSGTQSGTHSGNSSHLQSGVQSGMHSAGSKSATESVSMTRQGSNSKIDAANKAHDLGNLNLKFSGNEDEDEVEQVELDLETQQKNAAKDLEESEEKLSILGTTHMNTLLSLKEKHVLAKKEREEAYQTQFAEMELKNEMELNDLKKGQNEEVLESEKIQIRELEMEMQIRKTEFLALVERKVLNSLLKNVINGVISINPLGVIQRFNIAAEKMFGYSASEILGKNIKTLMPDRFSVNHDDYLFNYLNTGVKKVIGSGRAVSGLKKDGSEFPLHLSISEVNEDGFHQFTAILRDLTEEVETRLANNTDKYIISPIFVTDADGILIEANKYFYELIGTNEKDSKWVNPFDLPNVLPRDKKELLEKFRKSKIEKKLFECEFEMANENGCFLRFRLRAAPMLSAKNEIINWCGSFLNLQFDIDRGRDIYSFIGCFSCVVWKIDAKGVVLYANDSFQKYSGIDYTKTKVNMMSDTIVHKDDYNKNREIFTSALELKTPFQIERRLKSSSGNYRMFRANVTPLLDHEGKVTHFYGVCEDISDNLLMKAEVEELSDNLDLMAWKIDLKGNLLFANKMFKIFSGLKPNDSLDKTNIFSKTIVHAEDYNASIEALREGVSNKGSFEVRRRLKGVDGKYGSFISKGAPIFDQMDEVVGFFGTCNPV